MILAWSYDDRHTDVRAMIVVAVLTCRSDARYAVRPQHGSCAVPLVSPRLVVPARESGHSVRALLVRALGDSTQVFLP